MLNMNYKVECLPVTKFTDVQRQNLFLTIMRNFYDQIGMQDLSNYLPQMIFLVNKQGKPMIYLTKEYCAKNI